MDVVTKRDFDAFHRLLPSLLADSAKHGQYALIHRESVADVFPTFDTALEAGYDRFGLDTFLVQEVTDREEPQYFSRNVS